MHIHTYIYTYNSYVMNSPRKIPIGKERAEEKGAELGFGNSGFPMTGTKVGILLSSWRDL